MKKTPCTFRLGKYTLEALELIANELFAASNLRYYKSHGKPNRTRALEHAVRLACEQIRAKHASKQAASVAKRKKGKTQ